MRAAAKDELITTLKNRFEKNSGRHKGISWSAVLAKLEANPGTLQVLFEMERTGGEPDVIGHDKKADTFTFCDCSPESPKGRRSLCYDREALDSRKENRPGGNAIDMAASMGIEMLTEEQYRDMQRLGEFDTNTSSWVKTPPRIRTLGGAIFCDRRYGEVFAYHNGAGSYYAARGFRGSVSVSRQLSIRAMRIDIRVCIIPARPCCVSRWRSTISVQPRAAQRPGRRNRLLASSSNSGTAHGPDRACAQ